MGRVVGGEVSDWFLLLQLTLLRRELRAEQATEFVAALATMGHGEPVRNQNIAHLR